MDIQSWDALVGKRCQACEGGLPAYSPDEARAQLKHVHGDWELSADAKMISRKWKLKSFQQAMTLAVAVGQLAEEEQHHPDLHLTGYRFLRIDITTHAIGGLSENDFILAAKIDNLVSKNT
jgi:4a-hydroxytetrahydrobiopterin dehydratase